MNKNKTITNTSASRAIKFFLIAFVVSSLFFLDTEEANAVSTQWTAGGNRHGIVSGFNASTDKDTYLPGEKVTITVAGSSTDQSFGANTRGLNAISDFFGFGGGGTNRQGIAIDSYDYYGGYKSCGRGTVETLSPVVGSGDDGVTGYENVLVPEFLTSCGFSYSVNAPRYPGVSTIATLFGCGGVCERSSLRITVAEPTIVAPPLTMDVSVSQVGNTGNSGSSVSVPHGSSIDVQYSSTGCSSSTLNPGSIGASSDFSNDASGVVRYGPLNTPGAYNIFYLCDNPAGFKQATVRVNPPTVTTPPTAPTVQLYFSFLYKIKSFLVNAFV